MQSSSPRTRRIGWRRASSSRNYTARRTRRIGWRRASSSRNYAARRTRRVAGAAGVAALGATVAVGVAGLLRSPAPPQPDPAPVAAAFPVAAAQLTALLRQPPDYGPLTNPGRRGSCLAGLGYPAGTAVLGARTLETSGVLLLLAGDNPDSMVAVIVAANCSAADTGLSAEATLARPPS